METQEFLMLFFVGLVLAVIAMAASAQALGLEGENAAYAVAFPITERVAAGINFMYAQNENGRVDVTLPAVNCTVAFHERYVETTVSELGSKASFGLFVFSEPVAPGDIECGGTVRIERTGAAVTVSEVSA